MELPTEIRFTIYELALQQTIDNIVCPPFGTARLMPAPPCKRVRPAGSSNVNYLFKETEEYVRCPPIVGALALLHTNREIRSESADEFMRLADAHVQALSERKMDLIEAIPDVLQLKMSRFLRQPLFKTVEERWNETAFEYWEAFQDQRVAMKVYCLICHVAIGTMRRYRFDPEFKKNVQKVIELVRLAATPRPRKVLAAQ